LTQLVDPIGSHRPCGSPNEDQQIDQQHENNQSAKSPPLLGKEPAEGPINSVSLPTSRQTPKSYPLHQVVNERRHATCTG
jgi:hypothetical protein